MLKIGDKGGVVSQLQMMLNLLNYDIIVDGIFGPETEGAVKQFQSDAFIPSTGIVDDITWIQLIRLTQPSPPESISNPTKVGILLLAMIGVFAYFVWKD